MGFWYNKKIRFNPDHFDFLKALFVVTCRCSLDWNVPFFEILVLKSLLVVT